ncbi:hypothetical protein [Thermococcus sp.]
MQGFAPDLLKGYGHGDHRISMVVKLFNPILL